MWRWYEIEKIYYQSMEGDGMWVCLDSRLNLSVDSFVWDGWKGLLREKKGEAEMVGESRFCSDAKIGKD